jgi:AcrR family transcriptional regulator
MSTLPTKPVDRRVQRTRRVLREALISLILEQGWDAVSVQNICDRADVGRSTFYTHFADKEELLVGGLEDLGKSLRARFAALGSSPPLGFVAGLIDHAHEQRRLFRAIIGKRGGQVVQQKFRSRLVELVREDLSAVLPASAERDAAARFIAGGLLEVLSWWLEARSPLPPSEVERLFLRMAQPCVDALRAK